MSEAAGGGRDDCASENTLIWGFPGLLFYIPSLVLEKRIFIGSLGLRGDGFGKTIFSSNCDCTNVLDRSINFSFNFESLTLGARGIKNSITSRTGCGARSYRTSSRV